MKKRLVAVFTERYSPDDRPWDRVAAEAIRLGARAPDPRAALIEKVMEIMLRPDDKMWNPGDPYRRRSEEIVNYVLDNAPKEG